ncbi:MAG: LAGLIDADG family homing endonuclease [Candidatus Paceibacterota bacterium]
MPIYKKYNKNFFTKWSREMTYILGFLFADGNIVKTKRGTHFVAIYTNDRDLLKKIRTFFGSNHKISATRSKTGICYRIQIGSVQWFNDLHSLGLVVNKTRRMKLPSIPSIYLGDFIRGYFDGDGNVWKGTLHAERVKPTPIIMMSFTSASIDFLKGLRNLISNEGVIGGSLYKPKIGNYGRLSYSVNDSLKIYKIMYNDPHTLFLERKKVVFEKFICSRSSVG